MKTALFLLLAFSIASAEFSLGQALEKAKLNASDVVTASFDPAKETWSFETAGEAWIVPKSGDATHAPKAPALKPPEGQGVRIPCPDCQVLWPGTQKDCPTCHGQGVVFQQAQMMDEAGERALAQKRRARAEELMGKANGLKGEESHAAWKEAAQELRAALTDCLVYGLGYEAAWARRDSVPSAPGLKAALSAHVKASLRYAILDAEGRLGAR